MRVIIVGLGVQGNKRRQFLEKDFVASVDPINEKAEYRTLEEVPLSSFDAALLCIPDEPKVTLISYLLNHGKHVLVEKPLWVENEEQITYLEKLAVSKKLVCYTAYNHRFEPHFIRMKELIQSQALGKIYHCRLFYGNGTAKLVRDSVWRDQGAGVLPDLGSHLLDTARFWFELGDAKFSMISNQCFENRAPDHIVFKSLGTKPQLEFEMTLLSWRNHFACDVWAEKGSAHISSLCKWGPSTFTHRKRIFPSGIPTEDSITLVQSDPTWLREYQYFKSLCEIGHITDLSTDRWVHRSLQNLGSTIEERACA